MRLLYFYPPLYFDYFNYSESSMTNPLKKLLKSTKRTLYVNDEVLNSAPQGTQEGTFELFTLSKFVTDDELEKEYAARGLVPATIADIVAYDKKHRDILDEKEYVATHFKDAKGNWCYATFRRFDYSRDVYVDRDVSGWSGDSWFCGVKKEPFSRPSELTALAARVEKLESLVQRVKDQLL